ncbi:hypothetical protein D3C72_2372420 [compost metagenome]
MVLRLMPTKADHCSLKRTRSPIMKLSLRTRLEKYIDLDGVDGQFGSGTCVGESRL